MGKIRGLLLLGLVLCAFQGRADIFGKDDRKNPRFGSVEYRLSKSVAVGILTSMVDNNKLSGVDLYIDRMSDFMCKDEKFAAQPSLAYACTGFLVGPDLLMTAGHCSSNNGEVFDSSEYYCESYAWLFDYVETTSKKVKTERVPRDNLYNCKKIIYAVLDEEGVGRDFALIQLDRPVTNRSYLKLAKEKAKVGEPVSMIGAPMGMPLKVTNNAKVLKNSSDEGTFLTDLDAFSGNSGSPVFNKKNEVMGILVSGSPSAGTYKDKKAKCERYNFCDQDGKSCKVTDEGVVEKGSDVEKLFKYKDIIGDYVDFSKKRALQDVR